MTCYRWMDDVAFRNEVEKAEAQAEAAYTSLVQTAALPSWQAAAWWLERRKYMDFGRRDRVEVKIDLKAEVAKLAADLGLNEEDVLAEAEALLGSRR